MFSAAEKKVRIDQCEVSFLDRNVDARSSNLTAPSSSRHVDSSCRSNLILNFDTSSQLLSHFLVLCPSIFVHDMEQSQETTSILMSVVVWPSQQVSLYSSLVFVDSIHNPNPRTSFVTK